MSQSPSTGATVGQEIKKTLDPALMGAAASKFFSASIGDIVLVLSHSPAHKRHSFADIEWMVLPPVTLGQFHVVEAAHRERGFRAPLAVVTWAFVSEEVDRRLQRDLSHRMRLHQDEWRSGEIAWLIDATGSAEGVRAGLRWLSEGPFRERVLKVIVRGSGEAARVATLAEVMKLNAKPGSSGDVLTLNAITKSTLSAHPGAFRFV